MTEDSPNDLNLGHFGIPAYDVDNSQWSFARTPFGSGFRQLDRWTTVIPAALHFPVPRIPRTLRAAENATKALVRKHPELAPATGLVPQLEAVSAAAIATLSTYDTTVGQLMSFGRVAPHRKRVGFSRKVVALPAGECGNILRVQLLTKERYGWSTEENFRSCCYLEGASPKGDCGYWNEDAAAIQQVCFAESEEPDPFLAVRLPQRIVLFRPVYHPRPVAAPVSPLYNLPSSVVDVRPFHSVWVKDTGGTSHADVAFNPHYQRQLAVVDQDSRWSVWDIEGSRGSYTQSCAASGSIEVADAPGLDYEEDDGSKPWQEDGWARIMWVGDATRILISNRRQLALVDLKEPSRPLSIPQAIDQTSTRNFSQDWILDIKRHPTNEKHFLVLTSSRLYLYSVTPANYDLRLDSHSADALIVMSWTHFRGAEDITLQLYVQAMSDEEIGVFVHSRLNSLVTLYQVVSQSSASLPYRSFGPTSLRLDGYDDQTKPKTFLNFNIAELNYKNSEMVPPGAGHGYEDKGVRFHTLSAVLSDLSVVETMMCSMGPDTLTISLQDTKTVTWAKAIRPPAKKYKPKNIESSDEDDFVEPDGPINASGPQLKPGHLAPRLIDPMTSNPRRKMLNLSGLYELLTSDEPIVRDNSYEPAEPMEILDLVAEIKWRLDRPENVTPFTLGTLQEYAETAVTVDDIDEASAKMDELSLTSHASSLEVRRIASGRVLGFGGDSPQESHAVSSLYDMLLQNWVAPLPNTISPRIRQAKERIARRIAVGVVLASTRIREPEDHQDPAITQSQRSPDSAVALSSSLPQHSSQSDPLTQSSQSDPLTQSSQFDDLSQNVDRPSTLLNPLARLSKHLHIQDASPRQIHPNIKQVLSHWTLGADPTLYDWEATERGIAEERDLEKEDTRKRREKERRKKERHLRRQQRENELFTGRVENAKAESQPPAVRSQPQTMRSSPGPTFGAGSSQVHASSQPFGGALGVQSQAEPGKHGGRPAKKKKVKSRMSGF